MAAQEVDLIVCDAVDVLGPEALEVVDQIRRSSLRRGCRCLLDRWQRCHPVALPELEKHRRRDPGSPAYGAVARRSEQSRGITSLRQSLSAARRVKPGSASVASRTANERGGPGPAPSRLAV